MHPRRHCNTKEAVLLAQISIPRADAVVARLPANLFRLNEMVSFACICSNGGWSKFDSMQVEVRRRMSMGLMISAHYLPASWGSLTSGQVTSANTDSSQQQDPGGRLIQIVMRFNF